MHVSQSYTLSCEGVSYACVSNHTHLVVRACRIHVSQSYTLSCEGVFYACVSIIHT